MEIIVELVFYVVAELVLGLIGEALVEFGFYTLDVKKPGKISNRIFASFLYAICGVMIGLLSVKFVPLLTVGGSLFSVLYLVLAPIVGGFGLCFFHWIISYGIDDRPFFRVDKFVNGVTFVLAFALTRSIFG